MTKPIERFRRFQSDLEDALARLADFQEAVEEIRSDPFVAKPADAILDAANKVQTAAINLNAARQTLIDHARTVGIELPARASLGTIVDESATS